MAEAASKASGEGVKDTKMTAEQIVEGFQKLRQEQSILTEKIQELESDLQEHTLVEDMLKKLEPSRRCFRRVGGALVEKTVQDLTPELTTQKNQISESLSALKVQLEAKAREAMEYKKFHNIVIRGVDVPMGDVPVKAGGSK